MIIISHVSKTFGNKLLFSNVDLVLAGERRYGLVGANGAGKTTFFKMLTGEQEPSDGTITFASDATVGTMQQDQFRYLDELVMNVVMRGDAKLWEALNGRNELLKLETLDETAGYQLADYEDYISTHRFGYTAETRAELLLTGLGIAVEKQIEPLGTLSGGYKLRVLLAQALFNDPEILILDEPNNYLDIQTLGWLEHYLKVTYRGLLLFTSHDQEFLNGIATDILDIDYGEIRHYKGNYEQFMVQKKLLEDQKLHERSYKEKKITEMKAFVERFRASATRSRQALSREKQIDKIDLPEIEKSSRLTPSIQFNIARPSGQQVLAVNHISKAFEGRTVLNKINFSVNRGERIAIIGVNGIGKSTLLNIIMGRIAADSGSYTWGYETHTGYFAQEHSHMKQEQTTVYDWLVKHTNISNIQTIRSALGAMLFSAGAVEKHVSVLSGGEISRLLIAQLMLLKPNVLIFDEPTNHLDIEARGELARALSEYPGTLICVSHDRHFVSQIATRIISLSPNGLFSFDGNYTEYCAHGFDHLKRA